MDPLADQDKKPQPIEMTYNPKYMRFEGVIGVAPGTIIKIREYDWNCGVMVRVFEVQEGKPRPNFIMQGIECATCGGDGKDIENLEGPCPYCEGTGFSQI